MKNIISIVALSLLAYSSALAETLSINDQTRIITAYGIATGQIAAPPHDDPSHPPDKCGTSVVNDFWHNRDHLDPALMSALGVQLAGRPDSLILSRAYGSPAGRFLVHYIDVGVNAVYQPNVRTLVDTVPDYVVMIARIADSVYTHIIDTLRYPIPPLDSSYAGLDNRFDIYILGLSAQFYGLTYTDVQVTAITATSYLVLDNDYQSIAQYALRPLDAARVTIAHEYFHAVQFGMDFTEFDNTSSNPRGQYWMEMSAVWMEEECYDEINDYYAYLPYFLNDPTISLQAFGGAYNLHPYGAGIFPMFLTQRYGDSIIRKIWQECALQGQGPQFLTVCDAAIRAIEPPDGSLATALNEFSIWNYFTGQYGSVAPTLRDPLWDKTSHVFGYEEREAFPVIPVEAFVHVGRYPNSQQIGARPFSPEYNGTAYLLLQNLDTRDRCYGFARRDTSTTPDTIVFLSCDSCVRVDTSATPDTIVAMPCDSIIPPSTDSLYPRTDSLYQCLYDTIPCDYVLPIYLGVQHPSIIEWGISIIYQLADYPDSMEINRFVVPIGGDSLPVFIDLYAYHPNKYKSITIAVSPTSNNFLTYASFTGPLVGYAITDSGGYLSVIVTRPSAVMTPYPNPAVVGSMAGQPLTFRFQVASDSSNFNVTDNPLLLIDIYTVAGEIVKTINATFGGEDRLGVHSEGVYETGWDMKNSAAKNVASGVYLAYARLWDTPAKKRLLAEGKSKVALIR